MNDRLAVVTGAGGFIGFHLAKQLRELGWKVRGIDVKCPEFDNPAICADQFWYCDLRDSRECDHVVRGAERVYHFAADMGGIGYIGTQTATIAANNALIDTHMLVAAADAGVKRFFFPSSACVYRQLAQQGTNAVPLSEPDAMPADPEPGYGWAKLFTEQLCAYFRQDRGLRTYVARLHNVYGERGTFHGGREKAPAALCRKFAELPKDGGEVVVWGDGKCVRSFLYIDDCIDGIIKLVENERFWGPVNIGSEEAVSINGLATMIGEISGKPYRVRHDESAPIGVRYRNSNSGLARRILGWIPQTPLRRGLEKTYRWIESQVAQSYASRNINHD